MPTTLQLRVTVSENSLSRIIDSWPAILTKGEMVCDRVANQSLARLIEATPIRYSGGVRGAWSHQTLGPMQHVNSNPHKVMGWLERGTKAHGPKNAKAMFIPLNRRTSEAGPKVVMAANASARAGGALSRYGAAASNGRYKADAINYPYKFGVDFLFAKRVRGIRARRIARNEQKTASKELRDQLKSMLKEELS